MSKETAPTSPLYTDELSCLVKKHVQSLWNNEAENQTVVDADYYLTQCNSLNI